MELFFDIKTVFTLNWIVTYNCLNSLKWKYHKTQQTKQTKPNFISLKLYVEIIRMLFIY